MENTVVFIKPDISWWKWFYYVTKILRKGFSIEKIKIVKLDTAFVKEWYPDKVSKPYFHEIVDFLEGKRVPFFLLSGNNAIKRMRDWLGDTDPANAEEWQLRFGMKDRMRNGFHASDCQESALREEKLVFGKS